MKYKRNIIEIAITGCMPFISIALLFLIRFVSLGFRLPDSMYWVYMCVNVAIMLCFFIPFKSIFKDKYMSHERIKAKQEYYASRVQEVFNDNIASFDDWTKIEYEKRRKKFIVQTLQTCTILDYETFMAKYQMSSKKIYSDKDLTLKQRLKLIKMVANIAKLMPIKSASCLPSIDKVTPLNRITANMEKSDKLLTFKKVMQSVLICAGLAMIAVKPSSLVDNFMAIMTELLLKILMGCWYIYGASRVANHLVFNIYMRELSEKSLVIEEFLESKSN